MTGMVRRASPRSAPDTMPMSRDVYFCAKARGAPPAAPPATAGSRFRTPQRSYCYFSLTLLLNDEKHEREPGPWRAPSDAYTERTKGLMRERSRISVSVICYDSVQMICKATPNHVVSSHVVTISHDVGYDG